METSLHRDLKALYARDDAQFEVSLGNFRIDAVSGGRLVEIQHGSLAAIRPRKCGDRNEMIRWHITLGRIKLIPARAQRASISSVAPADANDPGSTQMARVLNCASPANAATKIPAVKPNRLPQSTGPGRRSARSTKT